MRFNIAELPSTGRHRDGVAALHPDRPVAVVGEVPAPRATPQPSPRPPSPCDDPLPSRSERSPPHGKGIVGKLLLTYVCSGAAVALEGSHGPQSQPDPGSHSPPSPSARGSDGGGGPSDGATAAPGRRALLGHRACENGTAMSPSVHRRQIVANITEHLALCGLEPSAIRGRGSPRLDASAAPTATPPTPMVPPSDGGAGGARGSKRIPEQVPRCPKRLRSAPAGGTITEGDVTPESRARRGGPPPDGAPAQINMQQARAKATAVKRKLLMPPAPGVEEPVGEGGLLCRSPPSKRSTLSGLLGPASWYQRSPAPGTTAQAQHCSSGATQLSLRRSFPECPDRPAATLLRSVGRLFCPWRGLTQFDGGKESPTLPTPPPKPRAPHRLGLLGSFEESALQGRLPPAGFVDGFTVELGASGSFCPRHASLPVLASFFAVAEDAAPSPYLGIVDLRPLGVRGYQVPRAGTIQMTLFNPSGSVVKMFVVIYDLRDMPPEHHTFLRQRTFSVPAGRRPQGTTPAGHDPLSTANTTTTTTSSSSSSTTAHRTLHYLIHLRLTSSRSGKLFLHSDVRLLFSRKSLDADSGSVELKSFTETPYAPRFSPLH